MFTRNFILAAVCVASLAGCATDRADKPVAQIASMQELTAYLQATPSSPINHLSAAARQRFIDSLVFTENGLGSFQYSELRSLSGSEIYQVLSLFGVQHTRPLMDTAPVGSFQEIVLEDGGDHDGYWCSSRATCSVASGNICTSNC